MKTIKHLTIGALAVLAVTLLFQTSITRADVQDQKGGDNGVGNRDHRDAKSTFTKWVTDWPNMAGVVGGAVGDGGFTGEVLKYSPGAGSDSVTKIEALYHFTGSKHSFTALVHVEQTGLKAVVIGVVTDGWLKGHAVTGEYTEGTCGTPSMPCYTGTVKIDRDTND